MKLSERMRTTWLVVIKHTVNPVTGRLARTARGPFSLVRHVGRRSGTVYETPIIVEPIEGGFVIALIYGPNVNWYKNVVAAGGCVVLRHRVSYVIDRLEPISTETAMSTFPAPERWILRLLKRRHFVKFVIQNGTDPGDQSGYQVKSGTSKGLPVSGTPCGTVPPWGVPSTSSI